MGYRRTNARHGVCDLAGGCYVHAMHIERPETKVPVPAQNSVRIFLDDWLHPMPVHDLFPRQQPLEVDIGCGKGRFLLARAADHPDINFLGIDRMLRRIRKIDRKIVRRRQRNVRLMRMDACYATMHLLPARSVRTYYVFFPDPWPKKKHHGHRLFNAEYVDALHRTLQPDGTVHIATDHAPYFDAIRETMINDARFLRVAPFVPAIHEKTDFELLYIDEKPIGRCSFAKKESLPESTVASSQKAPDDKDLPSV